MSPAGGPEPSKLGPVLTGGLVSHLRRHQTKHGCSLRGLRDWDKKRLENQNACYFFIVVTRGRSNAKHLSVEKDLSVDTNASSEWEVQCLLNLCFYMHLRARWSVLRFI